MYLKEDAVDFLKQDKLEELVKRYSEFITFPIKLYKMTYETVDVEEEEEEEETEGEEKDDDLEVEEEEDESKKYTQKKTETVSCHLIDTCLREGFKLIFVMLLTSRAYNYFSHLYHCSSRGCCDLWIHRI
jgi:HSP90 family molecular chaperone